MEPTWNINIRTWSLQLTSYKVMEIFSRNEVIVYGKRKFPEKLLEWKISSKSRHSPPCPLPPSLPLEYTHTSTLVGFPNSSPGKESACNVGDLGSITGLGRSPAEENGNPLQYSCLQNPTGREAWQATVHGVTDSDTTERLTCTHTHITRRHKPVVSWWALELFLCLGYCINK